MQKEATVYLDNAATTMACPEALSAAKDAAERIYANPSSLHGFGFSAEQLVNTARREIAQTISASPDEIVFTPGGTFADNLAILGAARRNSRQGRHIITTSIEHSAVLNAVKNLEQNEKFDVTYIRPDKSGHICGEDVLKAIRDDTILVSVMLVNNEIGTIQPVGEVAAAVKRRNAKILVHTDAVQAYTKIGINVAELGVDMLTLSGHKIHALKGSGAIYIKRGTKIDALIFGGGQEEGLAPGTEPVELIASFAAAAKAALNSESFEKASKLRDLALGELTLKCPDIRIISRGDVPHIFMVSLQGFKGETVLHFLEERGIFVSTGAACSRGKPSHVLTELGLEKAAIEGALRISLSRFTTEADINKLVSAIREASCRLVKSNI